MLSPFDSILDLVCVISDSALFFKNQPINNNIVHIDFVNKNIPSHSEYVLIQEGYTDAVLPNSIIKKLIDSLCGVDSDNLPIPSMSNRPAERYGIGPGQSIIKDKENALKELIKLTNAYLLNVPFSGSLLLNDEETLPSDVDTIIENDFDLDTIDKVGLPAGYKVCVKLSQSNGNKWAVYSLINNNWTVSDTQSYKTSLFWDLVDWYKTGYSSSTKFDTTIESMLQIPQLNIPDSGIIVKVAPLDSNWVLLNVKSQSDISIVGIQNGSIKINEELSANNPIELRNILNALYSEIFINEFKGYFNSIFFAMIKYVLAEQKYIDWVFKTSFISVQHNVRQLNNNTTTVLTTESAKEYINEVKPYRTKIREYIEKYTSIENYKGAATDFDIPAYFDRDVNRFRSPSGEFSKDSQILSTGYDNDRLINLDYVSWTNNHKYKVSSVQLVNAGLGYSREPTVLFTTKNGTPISGISARARLNTLNGSISNIVVTGSINTLIDTPIVVIVGPSTVPARAVAIIDNVTVRKIKSLVKFDRVSRLIDSADGAMERINQYYEPTVGMPENPEQLMAGLEFSGVHVKSIDYSSGGGYDGYKYDRFRYDNSQFDSSGNTILSDSLIDSKIKNEYLNSLTEIDIVGTDYNFGYAPEELVVLQCKEFISIRVYTEISSNKYGYRVLLSSSSLDGGTNNNVLTTYSRIVDSKSAELASDVEIDDTTIDIQSTSGFELNDNETGYAMIGNELISYIGVDIPNKLLLGVSRRLQNSPITLHSEGVLVERIDIIPGTMFAMKHTFGNNSFNIGYGDRQGSYSIPKFENFGSTTVTDGNGLAGSNTVEGKYIKLENCNNVFTTTN
jgi:hypothetical protein